MMMMMTMIYWQLSSLVILNRQGREVIVNANTIYLNILVLFLFYTETEEGVNFDSKALWIFESILPALSARFKSST